jgi:hypothetical protein
MLGVCFCFEWWAFVLVCCVCWTFVFVLNGGRLLLCVVIYCFFMLGVCFLCDLCSQLGSRTIFVGSCVCDLYSVARF